MKKTFIIFCVFILTFSASSIQQTVFQLQDIEIKGIVLKQGNTFFDVEKNYSQSTQSIGDFSNILRFNNDFSFKDFSGYGSLITANVGGARSKHTLKTFNGIKLNSETSGDFDLSLIEGELISYISTTKGAFSSFYGSTGGGGVIEFEGKNYTSNSLGFKFGSNSYKKTFLTFMPDENTLFFTSSKDFSDNMPSSDGRQLSHYLKHNNNNTSASVYFTDKKKYTPGSLSLPQPGNYTLDELYLVSLEHKLNSDIDFKISLNKLENIFFDNALSVENPTNTQNTGFQLNYTQPKYALTFNHEKTEGKTTQYADTNWDGTWDTVFIYNEKKDINSFKGELLISDNLFSSFRFEKHDNLESFTTYNIAYKFDSFTLSYATGVTVPTFNDLYWPDTGWGGGNPALTEEKSKNLMLSYSKNNFKTSVYHNTFDNLIEWKEVPAGSFIWIPVNVSEAEITGIEIEKFFFDNKVKLTAGYEHTEDENGSSLIYREKRKGSLTYQADDYSAVTLKHTGKRKHNAAVTLPGVTTVNYFYEKDGFFFNINNVFDKKYTINYDYPDEKRTVMFGVTRNI